MTWDCGDPQAGNQPRPLLSAFLSVAFWTNMDITKVSPKKWQKFEEVLEPVTVGRMPESLRDWGDARSQDASRPLSLFSWN